MDMDPAAEGAKIGNGAERGEEGTEKSNGEDDAHEKGMSKKKRMTMRVWKSPVRA